MQTSKKPENAELVIFDCGVIASADIEV